jgi:peptide chain release factor subunit 1
MIDDTVLVRYLDGELDAQTTTAVAEQLRRDPALQRQLAELRAVEAAYRTVFDEDHDLPYKPRMALLERLRREPPASHFDLVSRTDLETLAEVRSPNAPIFSLYLDLRPEIRKDQPPQACFKDMLRQAKQQLRPDQGSHAYREYWREETAYLHDWLDQERPLEGRGLAVLSCQAIGLWRVFRLPVPVRDQLVAADRPYLRQLATLLDEFESYLVVLIDSGTARLIEVRLGTAEELADVQGNVPPATGNVAEKTGHKHDTYLRRHARHVAERAEELWRERGVNWLVIGGTEEALGELRGQLPKSVRERLAGELRLSPEVELGRILDRVLALERDQERRVEAQRVEDLITATYKSGMGVFGLEETLLTVVEERVRLLVVEEEFTHAGWECPSCGFIAAAKQERCLLCGMTLNPQLDVVEVALERVLDQGGEIEVLRSPESRQRLAKYGRIGALLRYAYTSPPAEQNEHAAGGDSA